MKMKQSEVDRLAANLSAKFGLPIRGFVTAGSNGQEIILEPHEVDSNEGYRIRVQIGWRSITIDLEPGKFAGEVIREMGRADLQSRVMFSNIAEQIMQERGQLKFEVNGLPVDIRTPDNWPVEWKMLVFSLRKSPLEINTEDYILTEQLVSGWVERFYSCIISLTPLEKLYDEGDPLGQEEGNKVEEVAIRYERSRINRAVCISFHGHNCQVCDMNFGEYYGEIGEGFIHVHHIVPVSKLGAGYAVNPVKDLIPVCPNCHYMLHRKDPPFGIEELKKLINENRK
jgi:5-methylcytosine-specific restriction protein A